MLQINVDFKVKDLPAPGPTDVIVDIHAAALNFRDVLISINMLPELSFEGSFFGRHLGMEAAGVVTAVGAQVQGIKIGDRAAVCEPMCCSNRIMAPAQRVMLLDERISFEVAASSQSVYATAHYSLITVAKIRTGRGHALMFT